MEDFYAQLTGRRYARVSGYRVDDADYLLIGQGSWLATAEAVADYLRQTRGLRVGVINLVMWRPFPGDLISRLLKGKRGVTVLERLDQPLAIELPLIREIRALVSRCYENGRSAANAVSRTGKLSVRARMLPPSTPLRSAWAAATCNPKGLIGAVENMLDDGPRHKVLLPVDRLCARSPSTPKQRIRQEAILDAYPHVSSWRSTVRRIRI
jgi:pyruvate-ferredoxin/flavodoxin oxidoreductase